MSFGQTSKPKCGPAFLWMAFFPPKSWAQIISPQGSAQRPYGSGSPSNQLGSPSLRWMPGVSASLWDPRMRAAGGWGRAGAGERIWNTLRHQQEQLVNFVGMHLVERRCINIRSLSAYCVSHLGGGGAGGPQMPFVKKTRMASRSPRKVAACPRAVLRFRAQILGRAE